jgi:uncharacterized protein YbcI
MQTQGETESKISDLLNKFMREHMGRGPTHIKTNVTDDAVLVRLKGVLTETEKNLAMSDAGKELLISVRRHLMNTTGQLYVQKQFAENFNTQIINFYYDCNPISNEEIIVCIMLKPMRFRLKK